MAVNVADAFAANPKHVAVLGAWRNLDLRLAIEGGHFDFAAQRSDGKTDGHFTKQIITIPVKNIVWPNVHDHVKIAWRTSPFAGLAVARRAQTGASVHASRNAQGD